MTVLNKVYLVALSVRQIVRESGITYIDSDHNRNVQPKKSVDIAAMEVFQRISEK